MRGSRRGDLVFGLLRRAYFPLVVGLVLVVPGLAEPGLAFVPVDDFMFAPVVVDELVGVAAWCLVCLYIFADAAKGDPAKPAITSAVIVSLLFIMTWNSSLHHPGGNLLPAVRFRSDAECLTRRYPRCHVCVAMYALPCVRSGPGIQGGNGSRTAQSTRSAPDVDGGIGAGSMTLTHVGADGSSKISRQEVRGCQLNII